MNEHTLAAFGLIWPTIPQTTAAITIAKYANELPKINSNPVVIDNIALAIATPSNNNVFPATPLTLAAVSIPSSTLIPENTGFNFAIYKSSFYIYYTLFFVLFVILCIIKRKDLIQFLHPLPLNL